MQRYTDAGKYSAATASVTSPDGSTIFVTGYTYNGTTAYDYVTIAYATTTGRKLWMRRFDDRDHGGDYPTAIAVSPDGSMVFVTGYSWSDPTSSDYATVAYSAATGSRSWVRRYDGPAHDNDIAYAIAASPSGVFVTGYAWGEDYATVAYDPVTGRRLWTRRYAQGEAFALAVSPDGSTVFVTGEHYGATYDFGTVAYNAETGATRWVRTFDGPYHGFDAAYSIAASPDGSAVFITGETPGPRSRHQHVAIAYDASSGRVLWMRTSAGAALKGGHSFLTVSPNGDSVFVAEPSLSDYATIAYATGDGEELWHVTYDHGRADLPTAIGAADHTVYVTGYSESTTSTDYLTLAYGSAKGGVRWRARYSSGSGDLDEPAALSVSSNDAIVVVTGMSGDKTRESFNYATVAYPG